MSARILERIHLAQAVQRPSVQGEPRCSRRFGSLGTASLESEEVRLGFRSACAGRDPRLTLQAGLLLVNHQQRRQS